ncbi:hypothetical protein FQA39_LY14370 [Lamprigera yunnana]|nr:hypothetical protein FQA39_LY14370 [Lamprigera yunnana]
MAIQAEIFEIAFYLYERKVTIKNKQLGKLKNEDQNEVSFVANNNKMDSRSKPERLTNAKVFYRVFPMPKMEWEHVKILENKKTLYVRHLQDFNVPEGFVLPNYCKFDTDGIFYNDSQEEIYNAVMLNVIEKVLEGNNALILCFGQTGSGKTLTANGLHHCYNDRGIAPRLVSELFRAKEAASSKLQVCLQLSYIETKNTNMIDLLGSNCETNVHSFRHITAVTIKNFNSAMKVLFTAESRRKYVDCSLTSHISNGVLTITVITRPVHCTDSTQTLAKIHIVDLAGVDMYGNSTSWHKNSYDVSIANLAKSYLEQFVLTLIQNKPDAIHVKQRLNILIQYLSDSLNTNSILRGIGHIRIDKSSLPLTVSMLKFGETIRGIPSQTLQPYITKNTKFEVQFLENKIKEMQKEQDLNAMIASEDQSKNISQDRVQQMQNVAQQYLQNKINELVVANLVDTNTVLKVFKALCDKPEPEKENCLNLAQGYDDTLVNNRSDSTLTEMTLKRMSKITNGKEVTNLRNSEKSCQKLALPKKPLFNRNTICSHKKENINTDYHHQDKASITMKSIRRSKTSSLNILKKGSTKKKSISVSAIAPLNEVEERSLILPNNVPKCQEAWGLYIKDEIYLALEKERVRCEANAKLNQRLYLEEVKVLRFCYDTVDIRKKDLQRAEMSRLFNKQICSSPDNFEKLCLKNWECARNELVQQQERVLKYQTEFTFALNQHQNIKKEIRDKFEEFCEAQFQISVAMIDEDELQEVNDDLDITEMKENEMLQMALVKEEECSHYNELQAFMRCCIRKARVLKKRYKKWTNI